MTDPINQPKIPKPRPIEERNIQWVSFVTITRKELHRVFRIWPQTLLPSVMTMSLYFLIFGQFIGEKVGYIHGVPYMNYIVPGLIMMAIINNAYANVSSTFFSAKFQHYIDEVLVSPTSHLTFLLGQLSGGLIRSFMVAALVTGVAFLFTHMSVHSLLVVVFTSVLTSLLFCLAGFINAIFANKFDDIAIIPTFVLTPLTYLAGVFYSIDQLPVFWQKVSLLNPILYLVNAFRYGFLGISDIPVISSLVILTGVLIALFAWALYLLQKGVGLRQ